MQTSREDFSIAVRSAFLKRDVQQRFSLFALIIVCIILLFVEKIETKPLNYLRSFVKDIIYRGSVVVSSPSRGIKTVSSEIGTHIKVHEKYIKVLEENKILKDKSSDLDFLILENTQLRQLINEQTSSSSNLESARVMLDKQSPYLNSFIINIGTNRKLKNGLAVLDGKNFVGRLVDVNFFSSRVLLITDLNSKIPVVTQPSGYHAILNGRGKEKPSLDFLPKDHTVNTGDKVYTSGKEGIFSPGIPIGEISIEKDKVEVLLFSNLNQITFVNVNLGDEYKKE